LRGGGSALFNGRPLDAAAIQQRLMGVMVLRQRRLLEAGIVTCEDDIDVAMIFGTGFPPFRGGLVKWDTTRGCGDGL